jgi:hypothetical protein
MKTWSFYSEHDGIFVDRKIRANVERIALANAPPGCIAIEGDYDRLTQRVDIATGEVIGYQPPRPDDDHEWDERSERWVLRPEIAAWERSRQAALAELESIDAKRSRALSDQVLTPNMKADDGKTPRDRLQDLEVRAQSLRSIANAPKPALPERKPSKI